MPDKILVPIYNDVPLVIIVDINKNDIVINSIEHAKYAHTSLLPEISRKVLEMDFS